jgi:peptidoglycan hydrolase CwlO-like protein
MTGEEMERAIEFLLKNQAGFDAKLDRLADQVSETSKQVADVNGRLQMHAETQTELIQLVLRNAEEQRQINAEFRAAIRALAAAQTRTDEQLKRTDEQLRRTDEQLKRTDENLRRTDENLRRTDENLNRLAATVQSLAEGRG